MPKAGNSNSIFACKIKPLHSSQKEEIMLPRPAHGEEAENPHLTGSTAANVPHPAPDEKAPPPRRGLGAVTQTPSPPGSAVASLSPLSGGAAVRLLPLTHCIYDLAQTLNIYISMTEKLIDTPLMREIAALRRRVINQLGAAADPASQTPLADQAAADYAELSSCLSGYESTGAPAFGDRVAPDIKAMRDDFITRALHMGNSVEEIAQVLNIHPGCISKMKKGAAKYQDRNSGNPAQG